jgi:hypothetical protein
MKPPTEDEIRETLKKWKAVIPERDLKIIQQEYPTTPNEYLEKQEDWTFIGKIREYYIWTVNKLIGKDAGILAVVVTLFGFAVIVHTYGPPVIHSISEFPTYTASLMHHPEKTNPKIVIFQSQDIATQYTTPERNWDMLSPNTIVTGISGQHPMA